MGWDGAGGYTRQRNFSADASAGTKILASAMDQEFNDFASAMTLALARNGQNAPTANLPMGGFRHNNVGAAASATNYLRANEFIADIPVYVVDDNSNQIAISVSASYYATVSATQAPPDGARLRVATTFVSAGKSASVDMILNTPTGRHSGDIQMPNGWQPYPGQIRGVQDYVWSSARSAWICMNPWAFAKVFSAVPKIADAALTTAGVGEAVVCRAARTGNMAVVEVASPVSVSVSISARWVWLSGLPGWLFNGVVQGNPAFRVEAFKDSSAISLYAVATAGTSLEYRLVNDVDSFPISPHVLSANTIIRIPSHHVTWLFGDGV